MLLPLSSWLIDTGRSLRVLDAEAMTAHLTVIHQMVSKDTFVMTAASHSPSFLKTIFHSSNKDFETWASYLVMMTFNVPLEMMEETLNISHPTALLWKHKVFATVSNFQERLVLHGRVWINDTYIFDSTVLHEDGYKRKRGLSKDLICIVVAIDTEGNAYAEICGHGKPSASRI